MKSNSKIIPIILTILAVITAIAVIANYSHSKEQLALLESQEIVLFEKGEEICRIGFDDLTEIGPVEFEANLKSSAMLAPKTHTYTGVALSGLFMAAGIPLRDKSRIVAESLDGYQVPLKIEEVMALDNIFLVFKDDGKYLGAYNEAGGQGPYMMVIRGDKFSQRWAKYVIGLNVE
ncbi:hypothetical protein MASR2M70_09370 [Bacillota bacterium]